MKWWRRRRIVGPFSDRRRGALPRFEVELPAGFVEFDRVVVDKIQDLTLLETAVVVELCLVSARRRGHAPGLLAAGDDGQTVRPSGFGWGALNDLLAARLNAPRRFHREDNLRCPSASRRSSNARRSGTCTSTSRVARRSNVISREASTSTPTCFRSWPTYRRPSGYSVCSTRSRDWW